MDKLASKSNIAYKDNRDRQDPDIDEGSFPWKPCIYSLSVNGYTLSLLSTSQSSVLSHSITRSYKLPLPCGDDARVLPFYLFLSCSINLSVHAGGVSCIPNTKNNHFSVTSMGGCRKEGGGGVCVTVVVVVGGYLQLPGIRLKPDIAAAAAQARE